VRPDFLVSVSSSASADAGFKVKLIRTCYFFLLDYGASLVEETIRSVTHLVLALLHWRVRCAQSRILGIRKTFSAGPRSFSFTRALDVGALRFKRRLLQPVFDSQLGRIAFKAFLFCLTLLLLIA